MTGDRLEQVEQLLDQALHLAPGERAAFAERIGDAEVRAEVLSLLAANADRAGPSINRVIGQAARAISGEVETGRTLDHFRIVKRIGAGGMGEVYLARDLRLGREVALKLLPPLFEQDSDRLRLFEREARAAAALNHPNIMAVYEVGHVDGKSFIAAEYVEGDTLSQHLSRGPLPEAECLGLAGQIADALAAAHEKGIVHRDLKPANIKVRPDGTVKVLDFGLAKLTQKKRSSESGDETRTVTQLPTEAGAIVGTAAYMAPEQARGTPVDKRADIWAFGVVLYEMLTGECPFRRATITDTLAAVVKDEPDFTRLPASLQSLIRRSLSKDVRKRWQDIGDVRIAMEESVAAPVAAAAPSRVPWMVAGVACLAALAAVVPLLRPSKTAPKPLVRMLVDLGPDARLANDRGRHMFAISPDGMRIAFACDAPQGEMRVCMRRLDEARPVALAGTEGVERIFFSPDGKWIGFGTRGKLKKVSAEGGSPFTLCDAPFDRGAAWGDDGFVYAALSVRVGLMRIPENGGTPQPLTELKEKENAHRWPQILPGGKAVLFTANSQAGDYENASLDVVSLKTGQRRTLYRGGYYGRYLTSGHLVYMHKGTLFAARMDLARLELTGPPVPLLEDVASRAGDGGAAFDFSQSGTFVYESAAPTTQTTIQWLDRSGKLRPLLATPSTYREVRISPDGNRLALVAGPGGSPDLWTYDVARGILARLTFGGANEGPLWSPGGKFLAYHSGLGLGIWWIRADGAGEAQRLIDAKQMQTVTGIGNRHLALEITNPSAEEDLWTAPLEGAFSDTPKVGKPEVFLRTSASEGAAAFSPDERWLAYTSDQSGANQVYVRPFRQDSISDSRGKVQISPEGGYSAIWSRDKHELFYTSNDRKIMVVSYSTKGDSFLPEKPVLWCDFQVMPPFQAVRLSPSTIDLAPDGKRFAVIVPANHQSENPQTHVHVLFNFFDELQRRTSAVYGK